MPSELTPIEDLDQNILTLCTRINSATYELLVMIREFDERAGWTQWGLDNCAEWLAWRCDLSMTTAREKVRVAHALKLLPLISQAFSTGELSYSKVKAMTRVANRDNEQQLLEFALRHTAVTVAERCRELRCGSESSIGTTQRAWANRSLRVRRDVERNLMTITVELPLESAELLDKALDKARDDTAFGIPDLVDTSWSVRQADAFVNVLQGYLSGETGRNSDNYLVTIHVDESALADGDGRAAVPIEAVKRHCCDGHAVVITETSDGEPLGIGRRSRLIPKAIERAVRARDNHCCVFPGCNNRRFLDCHHVEHWAHGGETGVDNLMLLCTKHHTLVHEGGFRIRKDFLDNWAFFRPDGIAVPELGYVSRLDENPPAGGLSSVAESFVAEPPPPQYLH
jgi:hypothetical protein